MTLFLRLINSSTSVDTLDTFLSENIQSFYDLHDSDITNLTTERNDIRMFIETKSLLLENLDFSSNINKSFVSILFDLTERFGFLSVVRIENTLSKHTLYLGKRRQAAKLFLLNIRNNNDYLNRFNEICLLLQSAVETEEDSDKNILVTFASYFAKVIRDTSKEYAQELKSLLVSSKQQLAYPFLQSEFITRLLDIRLDDPETADNSIQIIIDEIFDRRIIIEVERETEQALFIELNTAYANLLSNSNFTFNTIRQIAVNNTNWGDSLAHRGIDPLQSESEMFIYLKSYGQMHKAKLEACYSVFPFHEINQNIEMIDWGCGQGLASVVFKDFINEKGIQLEVSKISLIEPSMLSLKRAALHVKLGNISNNITTICKGFDSLSNSDVKTNQKNIKIHLFSNILDVDEEFYSQINLINLIKQTQKGVNYFVCSSPFITDYKTNRIDNFVHSFTDCNDFILIESKDNRKGTWINGWSRVIRVFKATL